MNRAPTDVVLVNVSDRIATITLNRPEARNALSRQVRDTLPRVIAEADQRNDVDALVLTGADPAFCAGIDLKEIGSGAASFGSDAASDNNPGRGQPGGSRPFPPTTKPLIGAINGVAITGGLEVALGCDFLVASERARFADTHTRVGIQPGWGLTVLLAEAVGVRRAREMSATGNFVDASTALTWGLVNHVVPHDELLPFCRQLASDIVSNDQRAVQAIYETYDAGSLTTAAEAWEIEARAAAAWRGAGVDSAEVERRRRAIVDRGRSQL